MQFLMEVVIPDQAAVIDAELRLRYGSSIIVCNYDDYTS